MLTLAHASVTFPTLPVSHAVNVTMVLNARRGAAHRNYVQHYTFSAYYLKINGDAGNSLSCRFAACVLRIFLSSIHPS